MIQPRVTQVASILAGLLLVVIPAAKVIASSNEVPAAVSGQGTVLIVKDMGSEGSWTNATFDPEVVLPPAWAFGVLHGYYADQAGTLKNFKRLEAGDFPVDAIWEDSSFWDITTHGPAGYLDFKGDRKAFPDLPRLTQELARHDVRFGIWVWERIMDANLKVFQEFETNGYFKEGRIVGDGWHNVGLKSVGRSVDFSNTAAAELWAAKLRHFLDEGVDFFKIDANPTTDYVRTHFELSQKYGHHTQGRGFVLSHCNRGSLVDIKHFPACWTGDAQGSWNQLDYPNTRSWIMGGLRQQIEMVANPTWRQYSYPFLANDTGGFHPHSLKGKAAEELYIRWAQFSAFGSLMEVFGGPTVPDQNAPFGWPEAVQDNFREHTHLRLQLFPYIYTHALLTRLASTKIIQGEAAHPFQYRFGDAFLVAPVYEPGITNRAVWLPPGQRWIDYWTGQSYEGGEYVTIPAPLAHLPLLVRAGAIIPMRDYAPSVLRGNNATLTLDVYPEGAAAESQFTLYEDDGTSNAYLTNGFASTRITCQPGLKSVVLHIAEIQGDYDGKLKNRRWKLALHLALKPASVSIDGKQMLWKYDTKKGVVRVNWKAATTQASEVEVMR